MEKLLTFLVMLGVYFAIYEVENFTHKRAHKAHGHAAFIAVVVGHPSLVEAVKEFMVHMLLPLVAAH